MTDRQPETGTSSTAEERQAPETEASAGTEEREAPETATGETESQGRELSGSRIRHGKIVTIAVIVVLLVILAISFL